MRVLVTGGAGFIGSNLVEALLRRGDDVCALDNFATGRRENLQDAETWKAPGGAFHLLEGDVREPETVRRAVAGREVVFHLAAIPSVARSVADPWVSHQVNVDGTLQLLLAAREEGTRRFVFASSSSVYGESPTLPKIETMPTAPVSPYGLSKLAGESYCLLFHKLYRLPTIALRYFNVFGPRQDPMSQYAAVIPRFIRAAISGQRPTIFGDGEQTRDFTFVQNVVEANLRAAEARDDSCGEAYNIACGGRTSLLELVRMIGQAAGVALAPEHAPPRAGDIRHSLASVEKAQRGLDFAPAVDLAQGLAQTLAWHRARER